LRLGTCCRGCVCVCAEAEGQCREGREGRYQRQARKGIPILIQTACLFTHVYTSEICWNNCEKSEPRLELKTTAVPSTCTSVTAVTLSPQPRFRHNPFLP
ncbi:unnamed protein product, partial [Ectocarpus sp. 12 AP-2014]